MSKQTKNEWRIRTAICFAVMVGALYPVVAAAQTTQPSGSVIQVGGVTAPPPVSGGSAPDVGGVTPPPPVSGGSPPALAGVTAPQPVSSDVSSSSGADVGGVTSPGGLPNAGGGPQASSPSVAGAQARPLVLPNTGSGPARDADGLLAIFAGLVMVGSGVYMRRRASRPRAGAPA
ncbi:MAG: hypothetical protein LC797_09035 [Chloroflexi bacterium]|nr:hypothetical protein [Chloroflexota bacterium]